MGTASDADSGKPDSSTDPRPDQVPPTRRNRRLSESSPRDRHGVDRHDLDRHDLDRHSVVAREKEEFGGVKIGSAFFGWLTATGTAVLLTAFVAAAGTAVGLATSTGTDGATSQAPPDPRTVGILGALVLLVVLFVAYYCGGYVAGRMARFNGLRQGLAVWLWGVVVAALVAVLAAVAGSQYDILGRLNSFPRIPVSEGSLTTGGLIALLVVAVGSLAGALIGGLASMRFHRNVDKAGLGE